MLLKNNWPLNAPAADRRLPKSAEMMSKMKPAATQNPKKIIENKGFKKTPTIQQSQKWVSGEVFVSKWKGFFVAERSQNHNKPKNRRNKAPDL